MSSRISLHTPKCMASRFHPHSLFFGGYIALRRKSCAVLLGCLSCWQLARECCCVALHPFVRWEHRDENSEAAKKRRTSKAIYQRSDLSREESDRSAIESFPDSDRLTYVHHRPSKPRVLFCVGSIGIFYPTEKVRVDTVGDFQWRGIPKS